MSTKGSPNGATERCSMRHALLVRERTYSCTAVSMPARRNWRMEEGGTDWLHDARPGETGVFMSGEWVLVVPAGRLSSYGPHPCYRRSAATRRRPTFAQTLGHRLGFLAAPHVALSRFGGLQISLGGLDCCRGLAGRLLGLQRL